MTKKQSKPKKVPSKKEPEVFRYFNVAGEKLWGFRHRYYDALGNDEKKAIRVLIQRTLRYANS